TKTDFTALKAATDLASGGATPAPTGVTVALVDAAITEINTNRATYGAQQNRLERVISNQEATAENLQAAESRIRDVDMAKEMMEQTKNSILAQASQAMLAQSNQ
ncbi:flagellin, partial [Leptospira santarosai]|nr:flagellin [Leptospira santarosai]